MELLRDLYQIHSPSGKEYPMVKFVCRYVSTHIPEAQVEVDFWGNIYITKGKPGEGYPTLSCHLDQVQLLHSPDFKVVETDEMIYGYSDVHRRREGLGADDKNGIWICLRCLEGCPRLKVFMAVMEEKGMLGSRLAKMSFFKDSLYVIEPDSRDGGIVKHTLRGTPCSSDDFIRALGLEAHGFKVVPGRGTDILALKQNGLGVSCLNVGTGYYHPHKNDEYTLKPELLKALEFVQYIVNNVTSPFPHVYKAESRTWIVRVLNNCKLAVKYFAIKIMPINLILLWENRSFKNK